MGELARLGGALCLDFVNTAGGRGQPDSAGVLRDFEDLVAWAQHVGALSTRQGGDLLKRAASEPARAIAVHEQAMSLREALYRVFSSLAAGRAAEPADVATINAAVADTYRHLRLAPRPPSRLAPRPSSRLAPRPSLRLAPRPSFGIAPRPSLGLAPRPSLGIAPSGGGFAWEWYEVDGALDLPVWIVARSAADLLMSADLTRVRKCASEKCDWLFLDASRNRSRRWCDMAVCGNRAKARRNYARRRDTAAAGDAATREEKGRKA
jgi:predicted RNA-binding Zn ribbon-like protein